MMQPTIQDLKGDLPPINVMVPGLKPKTANESAGPCPFCGGNDRFVVFKNGKAWCRQCGWKGDNLDLFCKQTGTTIKELVKGQKKTDFQAIFDGQVKPTLPKKTQDYFECRGLGAVVSYLLAHRMVGWYAKESAITFALFHPKISEIVGIQRIPVDGSKKKAWKGSNLKDGVLIIKGKPGAPEIIVEAVMDGLSAKLLDDDYTIVCIFSASVVKKLKLLKLENPVLFFDNDDAGEKATKQALEVLSRAKVVDWSIAAPAGAKDVNDLLRGNHFKTIARMVEEAKPTGKITIPDTILHSNPGRGEEPSRSSSHQQSLFVPQQ